MVGLVKASVLHTSLPENYLTSTNCLQVSQTCIMQITMSMCCNVCVWHTVHLYVIGSSRQLQNLSTGFEEVGDKRLSNKDGALGPGTALSHGVEVIFLHMSLKDS